MDSPEHQRLTFLCPLGYWGLACDEIYPSVMDYLMSPDFVPALIRVPDATVEMPIDSSGEPWLLISATILMRHGNSALVECRDLAHLPAALRVGILQLAAPDTTLCWLDEALPIPPPWLDLLEAANVMPPPGYRQGSLVQQQVLRQLPSQKVLCFIQSQELELLHYLDCGEDIPESSIGIRFSRIAEYLQLDFCATLGLLNHLEDHNLLVRQIDLGVGTDSDQDWSINTPSELSYLSIPFHRAMTPELHTHITALEQTPQGRLKRHRGMTQLQQALQFYAAQL